MIPLFPHSAIHKRFLAIIPGITVIKIIPTIKYELIFSNYFNSNRFNSNFFSLSKIEAVKR
jgi:hypothetical protein